MNRRALIASGLAAAAGLVVPHHGLAQSVTSATRIVATGSYLIEILLQLGMARQLVGVSGGIDHLTTISRVPRLRGFRQMSAESVLALRPDLYISTPDITGPAVVGQLRQAGVEVVLFENEPTLPGIEERITDLGRVTGRVEAATALLGRFRTDLTDARGLVARSRTRPRGLFILSGGNRPTLVAGRGTGPANLLELSGCVNVATAIDGFKVMSQEAMIAAAPQFILINRDGRELRDGVPVALTAPGALLTPAGRAGRLISMPGEFLQGFGILTPSAMRALGRAVHPELARL
jgi:iron complex transport system substrate-binding protein